MRIPEFNLVSGPEEWSNGYMVHCFNYLGVPFKIMQYICREPEDEEYTYIHLDQNQGINLKDFIYEPEYRWVDRYPPTMPGILSVETVVVLLDFSRQQYYRGTVNGGSDKQKEFKEVLGL